MSRTPSFLAFHAYAKYKENARTPVKVRLMLSSEWFNCGVMVHGSFKDANFWIRFKVVRIWYPIILSYI